jgi:chorismate mutase
MNDATLAAYRESIDNIDAALVFLLAERFKVTKAVGRYKAEAGLPPADPDREGAG